MSWKPRPKRSRPEAGDYGGSVYALDAETGPVPSGSPHPTEFSTRPRRWLARPEGCQYSDPSRDSLVLVDEAAQGVAAPELHHGSMG
jgi:hypothetical protein